MTYKSGEVPQAGDAVIGAVGGAPARGKVLAVREGGAVLLERRAPYEGPGKPLKVQHDEVASSDLSLVYRHGAAAPAPVKPEKGTRKK